MINSIFKFRVEQDVFFMRDNGISTSKIMWRSYEEGYESPGRTDVQIRYRLRISGDAREESTLFASKEELLASL